VAHENQKVRVVGLRPLRPFSASSAFLFFPIFILNSPRRLTPGAEGRTNPGTAALFHDPLCAMDHEQLKEIAFPAVFLRAFGLRRRLGADTVL
jgi:hypothetical protein